MDATSSCVYTYVNEQTGTTWQYDLSQLYSTDGYEVPFTQVWNGVTYQTVFSINFCQVTTQPCYPSGYAADATTGAAVWFWNTQPACTYTTPGGVAYCNQGATTVNGQCCTSDCSVLSTSATPLYASPLSVSKVGQGSGDGIVLQFSTVSDSNTNKTICEAGTPTMALMYTLSCNTAVVLETKYVLTQGCEINFVIDSMYACATSATTSSTTSSTTAGPPEGMSGGSVFLLILFFAALLYFGVGTLILYFTTKTWTIPNRAVWQEFAVLVMAGVNFILAGCRKPAGNQYVDSGGPPGAVTGGDYVEASDGVRGGGGGASGGTSSNSATDAYDDL
jgi:hypothetical protein